MYLPCLVCPPVLNAQNGDTGINDTQNFREEHRNTGIFIYASSYIDVEKPLHRAERQIAMVRL